METYSEFLSRINSFEKSKLNLETNNFSPNPSLIKKVDSNNKFNKFYGDTVVFDLDDKTKVILFDYVKKLYNTVPNCFCETLVENTFHMTLHDLSNSPVLSEIAEDTFCNEINLLKKLEQSKYEQQTITMENTYVFNMVNTSLVLGLKPKDEIEYKKLMKLYDAVDSIKSLQYPFTPHITLAYYNRNGFSGNDVKNLEKAVNELNKNSFTVELSTDNLVYQKFTSMNNYIDIFKLT